MIVLLLGLVCGTTPRVVPAARQVLDPDPTTHEGFPRLVVAANGRWLLFTRLGTSHASDPARIMLRTSADEGRTWSSRRELWRDPDGWSAHNPVAVVAPDGTILLWCSRYEFQRNLRHHGVLARSTDHGETWSAFAPFDDSTARTCYYVTDAIRDGDDLLAVAACFQPPGREPCWDQVFRSADGGRTWSDLGSLTPPAANLGDEVGLARLGDGRILALLRGRRRAGLFRYESSDGGRSWSAEEQLGAQVGTLQRPFLTHLGGANWLLSGRQADARPLQVVAYLSTDDGRTWGGRCDLQAYLADGAYTTCAVRRDGTVVMAYYADPVVAKQPDIHVLELRVTGLGDVPQ